MRHLLTTACTITHVTGWTTDADGESTPTTATEATTCHMQPVRAQPGEQVVGELEAVGRWTCWLPDGVTVAAADTLTVDGDRFRVVGSPRRWCNPSRSVAFMAVDLEMAA